MATNSNSDDHVLLLRDELAALREAVETMQGDLQLARAEIDEVLTIAKVLAAIKITDDQALQDW